MDIIFLLLILCYGYIIAVSTFKIKDLGAIMAYEKGLLGMRQKRIDRKAARRDSAPMGSRKRNRLQNQINRLSDDPTRHGLLGRTEYMKGGDTADFDVTNPRDVLKFQKLAGLKADGIFGPKTASSWREYVNTQRAGEGKEAYFDEAVETPVGDDSVLSGDDSVLSGEDSVLGPGGYGEYFKKMWKGGK